MNEKNEPLPTSIQAGAPSPAPAATDSGASIEIGETSVLGRIVAAIKAHERWGLAFGVGVQLLVLASMIVLGTAKVLGGGVFR
jgi:hypothetical protein